MTMGTSFSHFIHARIPCPWDVRNGWGCNNPWFNYVWRRSGLRRDRTPGLSKTVPGAYEREAKKTRISVFDLMEEKRANSNLQNPAVALDWWNGNRSILADGDLTGFSHGLYTGNQTRRYLQGIIGSNSGTRKIIETFIASGVPINEIILTGGGKETSFF